MRGRLGVAAAAALALLATAGLVVIPSAPAVAAVGDTGSSSGAATFATAGTGLLRTQISWLTWGTSGSAVASGTTVTNWVQVSDIARVEVSCALTVVTGGVSAYRPGTWAGDGLDGMYNIGGTGTNNQMVIGLVSGDGRTDTFDVACSAALATYDGTGFAAGNRVSSAAVTLPGLVLADAESMGSGESITARPLTNAAGSTWRIIDTNPGCSTSGNITASRAADGTLSILPAGGNQCNDAATAGTATAVAYLDGDASMRVSVQGSGLQAAAIGFILDADYGDAPQSYGVSGALNRTWLTAGAITSATATAVAGPAVTFTEASVVAPGVTATSTPRLGPSLTYERVPLFSATAAGDTDNAFATAPTTLTTGTAGVTAITLAPRCRAAGWVQGWIDWNRNGKFDATEASNQVQCTSTAEPPATVTLTWTIPSDARGGTTFVRLVAASVQAELAPTGVMSSGEVEDFQVTANVRSLTVTKTAYTDAAMTTVAPAVPAVGSVLYYRLVLTNVGNTTYTTANPAYLYDDYSLAADDATFGTLATSPTTYGTATQAGSRITFTQTAGTFAANGTVTITYRLTVGSAGNGAMTNLARTSGVAIAAGTPITCDIGSADRLAAVCARVDLVSPSASVTKTANVAAIPAAGGTVGYTLTVTNTSTVPYTATSPARVVDYYGGLVGAASGTPVASASSGTVAPVDTANRLISWSGALPVGGSVTITVTVTVTSAVSNAMMTNLARVSYATLSTAAAQAACTAGEQTAVTCATHVLLRFAVAVTKTAYLATDTTFTTPIVGTTATPAVLAPGTTVVWRYVVTNTGSGALTNVVLTDTATDTATTISGTTSATTNPTITCPGYPSGTSVTIAALTAGAALTCTSVPTAIGVS